MEEDKRPHVIRKWNHGEVEVEEHVDYKMKPGPP